MAESGSFRLRWSNYQTAIMNVFHSLLQSETLVDITLASEGKWIRAHRLVLIACSEYFKEVLIHQPEKHVIIHLRDAPFSHLEALVTFMYRGEVNIARNELPGFIKTASSLRIRGLCSISQHIQGLGSEEGKESTRTASNQANEIPSKTSVASEKTVTGSPSHCSMSSIRASKRSKPEQSPNGIIPAVSTDTFQETRDPVVAVTAFAPAAHSASAGQRTLPNVSGPTVPKLVPTELVSESSASSIQVAVKSVRPQPQQEIAKAEDPLHIVPRFKFEVEDMDLGTTFLEDSMSSGSEELSDIEGQGASHKEAEGKSQLMCRDLRRPTRFKCPHCPRSYKSTGNLRRHEKFECFNVEPRFSCSECDYKAKQKHHLIFHLKYHHGMALLEKR